jgi:hypothetical protein
MKQKSLTNNRKALKSTPRGLEQDSASAISDSTLGQFEISSAAKSGAVSAEIASGALTPDALAAALLALLPEDRARLAALLLGEQAKGRVSEEMALPLPRTAQDATN